MVEAAATLQGQLIAAQSELEGLRQIYTDNNVRVRSVRARIGELKHELERLGGKGESATSISDQPGDSMYPSIRKLPLLGVSYADLYRRTKIQEAVLETLTKEYELAKVQEVKEILIDCDADTILLKVRQVGDAACHEGYKSCFFRRVEPEGLRVVGQRVFDPKQVYKK